MIQLLPMTNLVQDAFIQDGSKRDVCPSKVWRVDGRFIERGSYNELHGSKEGSKVAVEVVLLLASLASWRRPQLNWVCGDGHIAETRRGGGHQYQADQDDQRGVPNAEGTPGAEEGPQEILKTFTQCLTARCVY